MNSKRTQKSSSTHILLWLWIQKVKIFFLHLLKYSVCDYIFHFSCCQNAERIVKFALSENRKKWTKKIMTMRFLLIKKLDWNFFYFLLNSFFEENERLLIWNKYHKETIDLLIKEWAISYYKPLTLKPRAYRFSYRSVVF